MSKIKLFVLFLLLNLSFVSAFSQVILLTGPPGSGKGTQSKNIQAYFRENLDREITAYSVGELLRQAKLQGKLSKEDAATMEAGGLLPVANVAKIVGDTLNCKAGCILDGYPREIAAIEPLQKILARQGLTIDLILFFNLGREEALNRILGRGEGRSDDNMASFNRRWQAYQDETIPAIETLRKQYMPANKFVEIDSGQSREEVANLVRKALTRFKVTTKAGLVVFPALRDSRLTPL